MKREFIHTADGSTSIYLPEMNEHYHSKHGAIVESEHIFIKNGLLNKENLPRISVFEVGMGTGLNVLTSIRAATKFNLQVNYVTVEAFPVTMEEVEQINFSALLDMDHNILKDIHSSSWNVPHKINSNFSLTKNNSKLQEMNFGQEKFDVIYFDAFAPEKQNEMWSEEVFSSLFSILNEGGILVTYCVKGEIRRRLQKVGFKVEKLKGPEGGKREMCRAIKTIGQF